MIDHQRNFGARRHFLDRSPHRSLAGACASLLVLTLVSAPSVAQQHSFLTHHLRDVVAKGQAPRVGLLPPDQHLQIAIALPLRNQATLETLLKNLYDPQNPSYRKYLTVQEFTEQFGPTQDDYAAAVQFAKANDMTVTATSPNRQLIEIDASVASINKTFHVTMGVYQRPNAGGTFYAPDREPSVDLSVPLWHITGLDNFSPPRHFGGGSGPGGTFLGSDMRAAYYGGTALTGAGQTIGLYGLSPFRLSDIQSYFNNIRQPFNSSSVKAVAPSGFNTSCSSTQDCGEIAIDIEQSLSMAPAATILVYEGPSDAVILNRMASDDTANQLSLSGGWGPADPNSDDPIFQEFAAQGQSFYVASGDGGAFGSQTASGGPGGLDGGANVYSGTLLGTSQSWNGTAFTIGPAAGCKSLNFVQALGQTVALPAGQFSSLKMLATGVNGNQTSQNFTITYTDGETTAITQSLSDWFTPGGFSGESQAVKMAYRNGGGGGKNGGPVYLYGYSFGLKNTKTVKSITLPNDGNVAVLAFTLVNGSSKSKANLSSAFNGDGICMDGTACFIGSTFPSEDPYITSVGGTDLTTTGPGGAWVSESAWGGSGGGVNMAGFPIPYWQTSVINSANQGSTTLRNIPDVSMEANCDNYICANGSCTGGYCGTSFSTPRWVGFTALLNQQRAINGLGPVGFLNPTVYAIAADPTRYAADFHDITTGNNFNGASPNKYSAVPGYDLATGLGSPTANLINDLSADVKKGGCPPEEICGYCPPSCPHGCFIFKAGQTIGICKP